MKPLEREAGMKDRNGMGDNRTGAGRDTSGTGRAAGEGWQPAPAAPGDPADLEKVRASYDQDAEPVGTVGRAGKGRSIPAFLDRLGERLAFERAGIRLYELLVTKLESGASPSGPADAVTLRRFREEELRHFRMLWDCILSLGADPTAQTPGADLAGVKLAGLLQIIADPRATFAQSLEAMLIAELADLEGWRLLIIQAQAAGREDLASAFRRGMGDEEAQLDRLRAWWTGLCLGETEAVTPAPAVPVPS
jgi:hypothetical protein